MTKNKTIKEKISKAAEDTMECWRTEIHIRDCKGCCDNIRADGRNKALEEMKLDKRVPGNVCQLGVVEQGTSRGKLHYQREYGKIEGYNQAVDDLEKIKSKYDKNNNLGSSETKKK